MKIAIIFLIFVTLSLMVTPAFAGKQSLTINSFTADESSITLDWEFESESNHGAIKSLSIQVKDGNPSRNGNPSNQFAQVYEFTKESNTRNFQTVSILTTVNGGEPIEPDTRYFLHLIIQYYDGISERLTIGMITTSAEIIPPIDEPVPPEELASPRSGGCDDCTPPTLGYDSQGNKRVDNGVCINGTCIDGGYFHTDFSLQKTLPFTPNTVSLKYYENQGPSNIKLIQLGIGVQEIGSSISSSQAIIEVHLNNFKNDIYNPSIMKVELIDPDGIISGYNVNIELVPCLDGEVTPCLKTDFNYSYAKAPVSDILMANAIDYSRNVFNNYFNDGIEVFSYTPTPEETEPEQRDCIIYTVPDRKHPCQFLQLVEYEQQRALKVFADKYPPIHYERFSLTE